jgi:hypothetical protein
MEKIKKRRFSSEINSQRVNMDLPVTQKIETKEIKARKKDKLGKQKSVSPVWSPILLSGQIGKCRHKLISLVSP